MSASVLAEVAHPRAQIPLTPNAPVAPVADQQAKYPLVIISHGLAGTRNTYR
jgi:predicted dienelactone hydrolase